MNPSLPKSHPSECSDISTISHQFRLNWTVRKASFLQYCDGERVTPPRPGGRIRQIGEKDILARSKMYQFPGIGHLKLCLELHFQGRSFYSLKISDADRNLRDDIGIECAFVEIGSRIYYLATFRGLVPGLEFLQGKRLTVGALEDIPDVTHITVHCMIRVITEVQCFVSVIPVQEGQEGVNGEVVTCKSNFKPLNEANESKYPFDPWLDTVRVNTKEEKEYVRAIEKFMYGGQIPLYDVETAKAIIITAADKYDVSELVALSVEYLMENLTPENVADILKLAIDRSMTHLQLKCAVFLSKCKIQNEGKST